ncbi:MAG: DUF2961 domain-containing protein [Verrucomicrobiales bacterium]|jgi:hypothetical protein|nr:DUF2961 domain-containing protein [Verrucomicrobiales bacterium]
MTNKILTAISPALTVTALAADTLTYDDLTRRLHDPRAVALLPADGERSAQFSSRDRASVYDAATGFYQNWGANEDADGALRTEGDELVLAEMSGPGCIWRIWSADPRDGHVKIHLDGQPRPAVDLPFKDYFTGSVAPFNRPELVYEAARGKNNYTPIPFQKSCKITAAPGWGRFYLINYTQFPANTQVPTFSMSLSAAAAAALDEADRALAARGQEPGQRSSGRQRITNDRLLPSGVTKEVLTVEGPVVTPDGQRGATAITALTVRVKDLPADATARATVLRELCLQITWDDDASPSVWAPLGDFFGVAPFAGKFQSLMSGQRADGEFYAYWFMPFARRAKIEIVNDSAVARAVAVSVVCAPLARPEQYGRFHAKWHRDVLPQSDLSRTLDWPLLVTRGRGRYVGAQLHVWNGRIGWWGEGDEKFFIDGEQFPSTFGTGSEDYFGYAWCDWNLFDRALHGQNAAQRDNAGHTSLHRWQLADNVPFHTSFDGSIEKYFANRRPALYAATVYWYLAAGGDDPFKPLLVSERLGYWRDAVAADCDVLDAASMEAKQHTGGRLGVLMTDEYASKLGLSAGRELCLWTEARAGDTLTLKVHSMWYWRQAGKFRLLANCVTGSGMGRVQFRWNGEPVGAPVDLASPAAAEIQVDLGAREIKPGLHLLQIEMLGGNDAADRHAFALDSIRFAPAE